MNPTNWITLDIFLVDSDRRGSRSTNYSDEQQLFLGNLPHQATQDELRGIFSRYGKVVDLRIFSKVSGGGKGPQGQNSTTRVPNYGFITFEDTQTVVKVLQAGSICYPDENGQKLNIEEKKLRPPRPSMEGGGSRPSPNDGNMRPVGGQQQQQQQQLRGPGKIFYNALFHVDNNYTFFNVFRNFLNVTFVWILNVDCRSIIVLIFFVLFKQMPMENGEFSLQHFYPLQNGALVNKHSTADARTLKICS